MSTYSMNLHFKCECRVAISVFQLINTNLKFDSSHLSKLTAVITESVTVVNSVKKAELHMARCYYEANARMLMNF